MFSRITAGLGAALVACALVVGCAENKTPVVSDGGGGTGGAVVVEPKPLTVVTWNVQNLINETIDDDIDGGLDLEDTDPNYPEHRAAVGAVLSEIDADVVVLQEVEHDRVLEELDSEELGDAYPHIGHFNGNDPRGIDVAVMSKVPFEDLKSHRDEWFTKEGTMSPDYKFSRDVIEAHLVFNGRRVILLGVHFKAKDNDNPDKRLAEAQRTRRIAEELAGQYADSAILVLGDYNDTPQSPPWLAIEGMGELTFAPASALVLDIDRYTYSYGGNKELVDHQMMSPRFAGMLAESLIIHSAAVDDASDHAPLIATYLVE